MSSSFYRAVDSFLGFLGVGNVGWAYGASVLITGLITSSVGADLRSLGTYFTNWSLITQLAAYIAFLKNPKSHIWLFDLATVLVWTVALSFSIVTIVSGQMRAQMYALYGSLGFWAGNIIIHYLPLLFNYAAFYHAFLKDGKNSPVNRPPQSPLHVGVVAFSAAGESLCFFLLLEQVTNLEIPGLFIAYAATHSTKRVYHNELDEFAGSYWMGLVLLVPILFIVFNRNALDVFNVLSPEKKQKESNNNLLVSSLIY